MKDWLASYVNHMQTATTLAYALSDQAVSCLLREVDTYPKPGLVSHVDNGAHCDMDAELFYRSAKALAPYYFRLALSGTRNADMSELREIGIAAEAAMMDATGGVNTHRGAIFGLGMLVAAAGLRWTTGSMEALGHIVSERWGAKILNDEASTQSHGLQVARQYAVGGAREQAANGFPALYNTGLPALHAGRLITQGDEHAARVQACFALVAVLDDTNILYRAGMTGLQFAQAEAEQFLKTGGVGGENWLSLGINVHRRFVLCNLSPGGAADLLGMTLFVDAEEQRLTTHAVSDYPLEMSLC